MNGWIVDSIDAAVDALRRVDAIDRAACRAAFERRFTAERMARDYVAIYKRSARARREAASRRAPHEGRAPTPRDAYYIVAETGLDPETRALKDGETFGVFDVFGDITAAARGQGLYHDGTRHLSLLPAAADRSPAVPARLVHRAPAATCSRCISTNPDLPGDHELLVAARP